MSLVFVFVLTNGNKIQEKLPRSPTAECGQLPLLQFLVTVFLFGPGDSPADSPGSDLGRGGVPPPFTCIKKKRWVENVLRKKCTFL